MMYLWQIGEYVLRYVGEQDYAHINWQVQTVEYREWFAVDLRTVAIKAPVGQRSVSGDSRVLLVTLRSMMGGPTPPKFELTKDDLYAMIVTMGPYHAWESLLLSKNLKPPFTTCAWTPSFAL